MKTNSFFKNRFFGDQQFRTFITFSLALICSIVLIYFFDINESLLAYSNSILSVFIFVTLYFIFNIALKVLNKRLAIISEIVGLIFSFFIYLGNNILKYGTANIFSIKHVLIIILFSAIPSAITALIINFFPKINELTNNTGVQNKVFSSTHTFFIAWAIIFIAWLPIWLATYPGIFGYDSIHQLNYCKMGAINTSHPLIHTYLVGFFVYKVGNFFGSPETGMAFYSIFQMLALSAIFAYIYTYLRKKCMPHIFSLILLAFFALFPTNPIMAISSTKDILYSGFFALTVLLFCRIAENENCLYSLKFNIAFILITFSQIIFRSQGKYIFILAMLFLLFTFRRHWKRILILFICVITCFSIYSGPITRLCNGFDGGRGINEMMSVPCVQLSRALLNDVDELDEQEKSLIKEYIPDYEYYNIVPGISDNIKATFNKDKFKKSPTEFIKLWINVGLKSPRAYIDAWARLTIGLWYPDMNYRDTKAYHPYWEYYSTDESYGLPTVKQCPPKCLEKLTKALENLTYQNTYQKIPVISQLFSSAAPFWLLIVYFSICIYYKKYRLMLPAVLPLLLWLTLMLGPVVLYRYVYPLVIAVPILFGSIIASKDFLSNE